MFRKGDRPAQIVGGGSQAELGAHTFQFAHQEADLYASQELPQSALARKSPLQAMMD